MKIERSNPSAVAEAAAKRPDAAERAPSTKPAAKVEPDAVRRRDEVLAAIEDAKVASAAARSARLDELEAQVRAGTYRPDPQRIADRILESAELAAKLRAAISGG